MKIMKAKTIHDFTFSLKYMISLRFH